MEPQFWINISRGNVFGNTQYASFASKIHNASLPVFRDKY